MDGSSSPAGNANRNGLEDMFDEDNDPEPAPVSQSRPRAVADNDDNDNGDEDDEDEEDEDEDNEDEGDGVEQPARKRRKKTRGNRFIDIEAEVDEDDDEDEEEDGRHEADGFIVPGLEDDTPDAQAIADSDRRHRDYDRRQQEANEQDALKLAAAIDARDKQRRATQRDADEMGAAGLLPRTALMPDIDDPTIWAVKVKQGKEKELVTSVAAKGRSQDLNISACFCRDSLKGYIYVEARSEEYVRKALHGLVGVYAGRELQLVPLAERADLLTTRKKEVDLQVGGWVRFKRPWQYAGDIAQILEIPDNAEDMLLKYIPRIDYNKKDDAAADGKKRKKAGGEPAEKPIRGPRPPQAFFNPEDVKKVFGQKSVSYEKGKFYFQNDEYTDGYLNKYIKLTALSIEDINPSIEEIQKFAGDKKQRNTRTGDDDDDGDGNINADKDPDAMNLNMIAEAARKSAKSAFQPGDSVKIIEGALAGVIGTITSIANDKVTIQASPILHPEIMEPIETEFATVRKQFKIGDHVKVLNGKNADETGLVINVGEDDGTVSLLSDLTGLEIGAFAKDLREAAEVGGGSNSIGEYELHDFVLLDEHTAAVIYKIERNILRVVDQTNATRSVAASSVRGKVPTTAQPAATDSNGQSISKGDSMRESGEHITNRDLRSGTVLCVYKGLFAFLFNREIAENGGVFVVYAQYLISEAARINSKHNPDSTRMNPDAMGHMPPPALNVIGSAATRSRRDILQGKRVVCGSRTSHKGKEGLVVDVSGEFATVELASSNAKIKIEKNKLFIRNREGKLVKALDAYKQTDFYPKPIADGGITPNPYANGGKTPNPYATNLGRTPNPYAGGGKTPNPYADGGKTPNFYAAFGGKTPGGGQTPAYSGANSAFSVGRQTPRVGGTSNDAFNPSSQTPYTNTHGQSSAWGNSNTGSNYPASAPTPRAVNDVQTPGAANSWGHPNSNAGPTNAYTPAASNSDSYSSRYEGNVQTPAASAPTPAASSGGMPFQDPSRRALIEEANRLAASSSTAQPYSSNSSSNGASYGQPPTKITGSNQAPLANSRWGRPAAIDTSSQHGNAGHMPHTPGAYGGAPTPGPMSAPTPGADRHHSTGNYRTPAAETPGGMYQTPGLAYTPGPYNADPAYASNSSSNRAGVMQPFTGLPSDWPNEPGLQVMYKDSSRPALQALTLHQETANTYKIRFVAGQEFAAPIECLSPVNPMAPGQECFVIGHSNYRGQRVSVISKDDTECLVRLAKSGMDGITIDVRNLCVYQMP